MSSVNSPTARFRQRRALRAFPDKRGGWALVSPAGAHFRIRAAAGLLLWEALRGGGLTLDGMVAVLTARYPQTARQVLRRDAADFVAQLITAGFVIESGTHDMAQSCE